MEERSKKLGEDDEEIEDTGDVRHGSKVKRYMYVFHKYIFNHFPF